MAVQTADADWADDSFAARLADAAAAVADLAGAAGRLGEVAETGLAAVMGQLTTLVAQLDGLRVAVTRRVRDDGVFRLQGAASVAGWLRADPRAADAAPALAALAAHAHELPQVTGLLAEGSASLAQAGAACWQVAHLPEVVEPPRDADELADLASSGPEDELWAGLWRAGDVHAAADELFAGYLPRLDAAQLRILGAHLREAADAQARAGQDYDGYAARAVRLCRTLDGAGALSGHLHPEAAEQVLAAFEELGGKAGPHDRRTRAQRWADALVTLAGLAGAAPRPGRPDATGQLTSLLAGALAQLPRPLGGPSAALDIGRQSQGWTPRQRDALHALYGGRCARPGCARPIEVIHHIVHWLHGGKTKISNGAPLCLHDHWLVHEGGWRISRQPGGTLTFIPPPPTWRPGTIYRRGKPLPETTAGPHPA